MNQLSGAEALVRMLQLYGVQHIFGLCGDTSLPFYDALYRLDHGIEHVLTRDERSASYMADAYARVTGRVGICEGPSGGGATYLLPGLVEANESSIPVLGITSDVSVTSRGKYPLTELDQEGLYKPITKWNAVVDRADEIPSTVRSAFRAMTTGRTGAAHIGLPYDVQKQPVPPEEIWAQPEHARYPAWRSGPDPDAVKAAADLILSAKNPTFLCGGGVILSGATKEFEALVDLLRAPVAMTVSGHGALSDRHPLALGVVGSNGGVIETRQVLDKADAVVIVGCRAGSTTTEHWKVPRRGIPVVHIDVDPQVISANYKTEVALVSDVKLALLALTKDIAERIGSRPRDCVDGRESVRAAKAVKRERFMKLATSIDTPIRPERIVNTLQNVLPADSIVVADPGTPCPYFSAYFEQVERGRRFITNRAQGALGYSLPAVVGAWYGSPKSRCVAVMGDGSFGFTGGEIETIVRKQIPVMLVVITNGSYGWIKASQRAGYDRRYFSVDFGRVDHASIARAYGIEAWTVEAPEDLEPTMRRALATERPVLVDVIAQPLEEAAAPVSQWMG